MADFEIISPINDIEIIAIGNSIREIQRLRDTYGAGRWRKMKGIATIRFTDDTVRIAEVHWYETNSLGKQEVKIKHLLSK